MKKATIAIVLSVIVVIGSVVLWYYIPFKKASNVVVQCINMQYACGDCYEQQWRVVVLHNCYGKYAKYDSLVGTDIIVHYEKELDEKMAKEKCKSLICYDFFFYGDLYYSPYKGYVLETTVNRYKIRENCCSSLPEKE
jgi:hypothetical protein